MRRFRRSLAFKASVAALAVPAVRLDALPSTPSVLRPGYPHSPRDASCPPVSTRVYTFVNGWGTWNSSDQAAAAEGFDTWEASLRESGSPIVDIHSGANAFPIIRGTPREEPYDPDANHNHDEDSAGWDDHVSQTNCNKMQISTPSNYGDIVITAAHEMGHGLGFTHTGKVDSRQHAGGFTSGFYDAANSGRNPLMNASCPNIIRQSAPIADDWSHLTKQVVAGGQLMAESGFESSTVTPAVWRGTDIQMQSGTPYSGFDYVSIGHGTEIEQRARIFATGFTQFRVSSRYKTNGTGSSYFKLYAKRVSYSPWSCGTASFLDADWQEIQYSTKYDLDGATTWQLHSPGYLPFPLGSYFNYEFRVVVYDGSGDRLFLDNLRVEAL